MASEKVYLVDDDADVRLALQRLFASVGIAAEAFGSAQDFLDAYDPSLPACIVLDLAMPRLNGLQLQQRLAEEHAAPAIVFLTGHGDVAASVQAMKRGAVDFLTKPVDDEVLLSTVREALARQRSQGETRHERERLRERLATLTGRQHEVLQGVLAGRLNKQIAGDLGITEATVKLHRGVIMGKLGVRSVAVLVQLVERYGTRR